MSLITYIGMSYLAQKLQKNAIFYKPEVFTTQLNGFSFHKHMIPPIS